jgi:Ubiquitin family.
LNNSIDLFKIVYKNKELNDNLSISELGIKENETLMIFCKNKKELEDILRKKNIL